MAHLPFSHTFSGARARAAVNGRIVGFAAGVSGSESVDYEPVDVLDLLEIREFVPTAYRATLSMQIFRIIGESLKQQGIFPKSDDLSILTSGDLTVTVEDKLTNSTAYQFEQCRAAENSWDISARGLVSQNLSMVCIRVKDEFERPING